jgi:epoxyqueuosine reductase
MMNSLQQWSSPQGVRLQGIPISRLQDVRSEIEDFKKTGELNGFQKWITTDLYRFDLPADTGFPVRSLILAAIPHPFSARVGFVRQAKRHEVTSLVRSDFEAAENDLRDYLSARKYHLRPARNLPLKRLGVQSGLSVYGKNNITYVEGMGSQFSLAAYFSDAPCEQDAWREVRVAERCADCRVCFKSCPTGAIQKDRFLINNEICLSNLNESEGEFPGWLPKSVHHTLYDCLKCQIGCPMNKEYLTNTVGPIEFSEAETELLLSGSGWDDFPGEMQKKARYLGMDEWLESIPRNLKALFELSEA